MRKLEVGKGNSFGVFARTKKEKKIDFLVSDRVSGLKEGGINSTQAAEGGKSRTAWDTFSKGCYLPSDRESARATKTEKRTYGDSQKV